MNLNGKTELHEAARSGNIMLVERILTSQKCNVNSLKRGDWTPIMMAAAKGHLNVVKLLTEKAANLEMKNKDGWTVLHLACRQGSDDMVLYLVGRWPSLLSMYTRNGRSCLHTAALHGHSTILSYLLQYNCKDLSVNHRDSCGTTPLMDAARANQTNCMMLLLKAGADISTLDSLGRTLFHIAAQANALDSLKLLFTFPPFNCSASTPDGTTPLILAAREGSVEAVEILLSNGIVYDQLTATDNHGRNALDHAKIVSKKNMIALLEKWFSTLNK